MKELDSLSPFSETIWRALTGAPPSCGNGVVVSGRGGSSALGGGNGRPAHGGKGDQVMVLVVLSALPGLVDVENLPLVHSKTRTILVRPALGDLTRGVRGGLGGSGGLVGFFNLISASKWRMWRARLRRRAIWDEWWGGGCGRRRWRWWLGRGRLWLWLLRGRRC